MKITIPRLILVLGLLLSVFVLLQFRSKRVVVHPTTTSIVSPLASDGLPDFIEYLDAKQRADVSREENAAVEFWKAVGPDEGMVDRYERVCSALGIEEPPGAFLIPIESEATIESVEVFLKDRYGDEEFLVFGVQSEALGAENDISSAEALTFSTHSWPWGKTEFPPLAEWVEQNQQPLDLLVSGMKKPKFYSPLATNSEEQAEPVYWVGLNTAMKARMVGRCLSSRCMYRVHASDLDGSIEDAQAILNMSERIHGSFFVERLVQLAVRRMGFQCFKVILADDDLTKVQADRCRQILNGISRRVELRDAIESSRLAFIDSAIRMTVGRYGDSNGLEYDLELGPMGHEILRGTMDPNVVLRFGNECFDAVQTAFEIEDLAKRKLAYSQAMKKVSDEVPGSVLQALSVLSRRRRSRITGAVLLPNFLPYDTALIEKDEARLKLVCVAAALVDYRLDKKQYPSSLEELMSLREELKPDDWTETPFKYQRIEDGFLLYGVGINGVDDGGCNGDEDGATAPWRVVNGKWVNASDSAESDGFMTGDDDVIRFPIPDVKWHRPIAN